MLEKKTSSHFELIELKITTRGILRAGKTLLFSEFEFLCQSMNIPNGIMQKISRQICGLENFTR